MSVTGLVITMRWRGTNSGKRWLLFFLVIFSLQIQLFTVPAGALPGPGADWTLATDAAFSTARYSHSSVVFDGRMWVIGGVDDSYMLRNDTWASPDGILWSEETGAAPFSARWAHSSVVFGNRMWVIGGLAEAGVLNDTWSSEDGVVWTEETAAAPFPARFGHTSVVFDGRMWVIGGYADDGTGSYSYTNDVWSSPDGITWTEETGGAPFPARNFHASVVYDGRMWVIGGTSDTGDFNDAWSSADGVAWTEETGAAFPSARYGAGAVAGDGGIWVIGGFGDSANLAEVWSSADGTAWTEETDAAAFPGRNSHTSVMFNTRLWVIGGLGDDGSLADAWYSPLTAAPTVTGITPAAGTNTGPVTISDLKGSGFIDGATVFLNRTGAPDIAGTDVVVESAGKITCIFDLAGAPYGTYHVVVVNPDGQTGMLAHGFTVTGDPPAVTGISPSTGTNNGVIEITALTGSNFAPGATVVLNRTGYAMVAATDVAVVDPATITCRFDITGASPGTWNVVVANPDGRQGMLIGGFTITEPPLAVTTVIANTTIDGLVVTGAGTRQSVAIDAGVLPSAFMPNSSVVEVQPPADRGFRNITIYALDGKGFTRDGDTITGTITMVRLETGELSPGGYSPLVGPQPSVSYAIEMAKYPEHALLTTKMWEGATAYDRSDFLKIAYGNDASYLGTAYTVTIMKTNIPSVRKATLRMSVNASWNPSFNDGGSRVFIQRIADDREEGEVLRTRYMSYNPENNFEYYEAESPRGLSTFGLSALSGNNNPFQLIVLTVSSYLGDSQEEATTPVPVTTVPATPTAVPTMNATPLPPSSTVLDTRTAKLFTNAQGKVTQETILVSADGFETVSLGTGVTATDRDGTPLTSISLAPVPGSMLPAGPVGGAYFFAGRACDLGPDGALVSPPATVVIRVPPDARFDQEFAIRVLDRSTGTWEELPASFDPVTMTIAANVTRFSAIALFEKTVAAQPSRSASPAAPVQEAETQKPSHPSTAVDIFTGMMIWAGSTLAGNAALALLAIVVIAGAFIFARRR